MKWFSRKHLAVVFLAFGASCASQEGVRNLTDAEHKYFESLRNELSRTQRGMELVARGATALEAAALETIAENDAKASTAALSERLSTTPALAESAPADAAARRPSAFQALAELALARAEADAARARDCELRNAQMLAGLAALQQVVDEAQKSGKLLHEYLDRPVPAVLLESIRESRRQVEAFRAGLSAADATNPAISRMRFAAEAASKQGERAERALEKLLEHWSKLDAIKNSK